MLALFLPGVHRLRWSPLAGLLVTGVGGVSGVLYVHDHSANARPPDPYDIIQELRATLMVYGHLLLVGFLIKIGMSGSELIGYEPGTALSNVAILAYYIHITWYQVYIAYTKDQQDKKLYGADQAKTMADFEALLADMSKRADFEAYLERHFANESLRFMTEAQKWSATMNDVTQSSTRSRATRIVNVFIKQYAFLSINISGDKRALAIENVQNEEVDIEADLFDEAIKEIKSMLFMDPYRRFIVEQKGRV